MGKSQAIFQNMLLTFSLETVNIHYMDKIRRHLIIRGRVQGVWFRGSTQAQAVANHVNGWVRNLNDGSVEAVLEGSAGDVECVIHWCRRGPVYAQVAEIVVTTEEYSGEFETFSVRR